MRTFEKRGTVVCSDSCGLSKLSIAKPLFEVLHYIHEPKQVIMAFARAIGGRPIGTWAADNTEVFFDESVPVAKIVEQMVAAQKEIAKLSVQVGIGIHTGKFFEIGDGLHGDEADYIERLSESHTNAGEVVLTEEAFKSAKTGWGKPDTAWNGRKITRINSRDCEVAGTRHTDSSYPIPFSHIFESALNTGDLEKIADVASYYAMNRVVLLVKVFHESKPLLLDMLSEWIAANSVIHKLDHEYELEAIKSNGSLGIFVADRVDVAADFARATRANLKEHGLQINIGISKGEVYVFPLKNEGREIAGAPVNLASKLAEDTEERDIIFIHESAVEGNYIHGDREEFERSTSGVALRGVKLL
jgi:class 3 adenylate cyclase